MKKTLTTCYGALAMLATGLAAGIALLFLVALVFGGSAGAVVSEFAGTAARWGVSVAAVAVLLGLVHTCLSGSHSLTAGSAARETGGDEDGGRLTATDPRDAGPARSERGGPVSAARRGSP